MTKANAPPAISSFAPRAAAIRRSRRTAAPCWCSSCSRPRDSRRPWRPLPLLRLDVQLADQPAVELGLALQMGVEVGAADRIGIERLGDELGPDVRGEQRDAEPVDQLRHG